ncbi:MAG: trehalose-6-phosphate synthase [Candidatus Aminicenantes bacterium]|nr:trehalose-6-phosphate synthase [Candidatus Aminicenantes bacterium]MCJ7487153.1 trehalose-6-phosphate synthase [Candidatus Aminicenantes bacterium]
MVWNRESLRRVVADKIGDHKFIVVSNREPYIHVYGDDGIQCMTPASGMTVALDPVIQACGGTWIAAGTGEADRDVVDDRDHVAVPPEDPSYTLRRIWLTKKEEERYYYGYANEGLWPLSHIVHVRPAFREKDWKVYREVNARFAEAVLEELEGQPGFVFIQDYHFALLSQMIKEKRPDVVTAQFWHIPWPNPEAFRVCPQAKEILEGLLGNDILGFHIRYHCLNFMESVDRFLESRTDHENFSIIRHGRETLVRDFPISIDFERIENRAISPEIERRKTLIRSDRKLRDRLLVVGIDRMEYTKGIVERLDAVDRLLEKYPRFIGRFVFLQHGPLSRIHIRKYRDYNDEITRRVVDINERWKTKDWEPVILQKSHLPFDDVLAHYRAADVVLVSSIHDGMNLVAKEFVAARADERGVLVLSKFTGSARELDRAVLINPMDTEHFADSLQEALEMPEDEQAERMRRMRDVVRENNVYRWAGRIINEMRRQI